MGAPSRWPAMLAVLIISVFMALPLLAEGRVKGNKGSQRPASEQDMRLKRIDCERSQCRTLNGEERSTCTYKCISPQCFQEVYAHDELEEGEIDTERARQFAFCFKKVHRAETEKRNEKMRKDAQERRAILAEQRAKQQSTGSSTKIA